MGAFLLERFRSLTPGTDLPQLKAALESRHSPRADGKPPWYSILNISQTETEITIFDFIGFGGVSAADFIRELADIKTPKISLRVNSPGGDFDDGIAIFNAIRRHKSEVTAFVEGMAASAASFLIMAAHAVVMQPHSRMMIHDAHGLALGPADELRNFAAELDDASDNIAAIYAEKAGGMVEEWRARMKAETFLSDQEAVDLGLADSIDGEGEQAVAARVEARKPIPENMPSENKPTDGPEEKPTPIDWRQAMQDIATEDDEAVFAMEGATS